MGIYVCKGLGFRALRVQVPKNEVLGFKGICIGSSVSKGPSTQ